MAITKSYGFDTNGTRWSTFKPFVLPASTLVLKKDEPNEVVMEAKASPYDRPETFTWGATSVRDVYKNSSVALAARPATSRGIQLLAKYNGFITVTDPDIPELLKVLPIQAHTVLVIPINEYITETDVLAILSRQAGMLLPGDSSSTPSNRLAELLRSALKPTT